jgi:hypothetical protein
MRCLQDDLKVIGEAGVALLNRTPELDYLTHIVFRSATRLHV